MSRLSDAGHTGNLATLPKRQVNHLVLKLPPVILEHCHHSGSVVLSPWLALTARPNPIQPKSVFCREYTANRYSEKGRGSKIHVSTWTLIALRFLFLGTYAKSAS